MKMAEWSPDIFWYLLLPPKLRVAFGLLSRWDLAKQWGLPGKGTGLHLGQTRVAATHQPLTSLHLPEPHSVHLQSGTGGHGDQPTTRCFRQSAERRKKEYRLPQPGPTLVCFLTKEDFFFFLLGLGSWISWIGNFSLSAQISPLPYSLSYPPHPYPVRLPEKIQDAQINLNLQ